jgi:hypothetical protein
MSRTNEWIRDRLPTEEDADLNGDIQIKVSPYFEAATTDHWSQVAAGVFWRHTRYWNPQQVDRIAALERRIVELERVVSEMIKGPSKRRSLGVL